MYDVIVVRARCAGAPPAMLLAQRGYRCCWWTAPPFPRDTLSTHFIKPPGVAMLRRWGLLDRVIACGCPPVGRFRFDYSPVVLAGSPRRWTAPASATRRAGRSWMPSCRIWGLRG